MGRRPMNSPVLPEELAKETGKLIVEFSYEGDSMTTDVFRKAINVARAVDAEIVAKFMGIPVPVFADSNVNNVKLAYHSMVEMAKLHGEIERLKKIEEAYNLLINSQK